MKMYYGYWSNGNTYNREPYTDTNLKRLKRDMAKIVRGNDTGNGGWWHIYDSDAPETYEGEHTVAEGRC
jgi:hypothetical protein